MNELYTRKNLVEYLIEKDYDEEDLVDLSYQELWDEIEENYGITDFIRFVNR